MLTRGATVHAPRFAKNDSGQHRYPADDEERRGCRGSFLERSVPSYLNFSLECSLRVRQMLLQFGQYFADFRSFRHRRGLRVFSDSEFMMLAYGLKHLEHFRVLLFGKKIYLEIEVVSLIRLNTTAVLTHEDEQREENRFQRDDRGQKLVRERVEGEPALGSAVEPQPKGKPDRVKKDKPHFSRVRGDGVADTGRKGSLRQRAVFQLGNYFDVAGSRRGRFHSFMLCRDLRAGKHR